MQLSCGLRNFPRQAAVAEADVDAAGGEIGDPVVEVAEDAQEGGPLRCAATGIGHSSDFLHCLACRLGVRAGPSFRLGDAWSVRPISHYAIAVFMLLSIWTVACASFSAGMA